jgi:hypothetical protein
MLNYLKIAAPFVFMERLYSSLEEIYKESLLYTVYELIFPPGSSLVPKFSILECSGQQWYQCFPSFPPFWDLVKRGAPPYPPLR